MRYKENKITDLKKNYLFTILCAEPELKEYYHYNKLSLDKLKIFNGILYEFKTFENIDVISKNLKKLTKRNSSNIILSKSLNNIEKIENYEFIEYDHLKMFASGDLLDEPFTKTIVSIIDNMLDLRPSLKEYLPNLIKDIRSEKIKDHLQKIIDNPNILGKKQLRHSR